MADAPSLLPAYLIIGTDRPKVRRAVARLRQRVIEEAESVGEHPDERRQDGPTEHR